MIKEIVCFRLVIFDGEPTTIITKIFILIMVEHIQLYSAKHLVVRMKSFSMLYFALSLKNISCSSPDI